MELLLVIAGLCLAVWTGIAIYVLVLLNRFSRSLAKAYLLARFGSRVFELWRRL